MSATFDEADAVLKTERLTLRVLRESDLEAIWPYVADAEISRFMSWVPHDSMEETRAFISDVRRRMAEGVTIAWIIEEQGNVCGLVSLIGIVRKHRALHYDKAELAYWLGRDFRGRGIATEACEAVLRYAFNRLDLNKIVVAHVTQNDASRDLILRLGFRCVGTEYQHFSKEGQWFDHVLYELLRTAWLQR
jgi:RimJ/RimL family protein N-acetyltransferase